MSDEPAVLARAAGPRGEVLLRRHPDGRLELRVNGVFVMDDAETGSERMLARTGLDAAVDPARVLVGGLGLGFTARAVLTDARVRRLEVVEIEEALVDWTRADLVPGGRALVEDPRVRLVLGDVAAVVRAAPASSYDVVLLDVDNGPGYLVHDANAEVYRPAFLTACHEALAPAGVLVVWSASDAPGLEARIADVFGDCAWITHAVRLGERDEEYLLYVGRSSVEA